MNHQIETKRRKIQKNENELHVEVDKTDIGVTQKNERYNDFSEKYNSDSEMLQENTGQKLQESIDNSQELPESICSAPRE